MIDRDAMERATEESAAADTDRFCEEFGIDPDALKDHAKEYAQLGATFASTIGSHEDVMAVCWVTGFEVGLRLGKEQS